MPARLKRTGNYRLGSARELPMQHVCTLCDTYEDFVCTCGCRGFSFSFREKPWETRASVWVPTGCLFHERHRNQFAMWGGGQQDGWMDLGKQWERGGDWSVTEGADKTNYTSNPFISARREIQRETWEGGTKLGERGKLNVDGSKGSLNTPTRDHFWLSYYETNNKQHKQLYFHQHL